MSDRPPQQRQTLSLVLKSLAGIIVIGLFAIWSQQGPRLHFVESDFKGFEPRSVPLNEKLLIQFRDNGTAHEDIHLRLQSFSETADSYYLALDDQLLPGTETPEKVCKVLISLLEHWQSALQKISEDQPVFLPYGFYDQGISTLKCRLVKDSLEITTGSSSKDGYAVSPSNPSEIFFDSNGFHSGNSPAIHISKTDFLDQIRKSILDTQAQAKTMTVKPND